MRKDPDIEIVPLYGEENDTIPGPQPEWAQNLTQIEELLVSPILTMMSVYTLSGGSHKHRGNCINFEQNLTEIATKLPRLPSEIATVIIQSRRTELPHKTFKVNRAKIEIFLRKAKENNLYGFESIEICEENLAQLPLDGVPTDLKTITDPDLVIPLISPGPNDQEFPEPYTSNDEQKFPEPYTSNDEQKFPEPYTSNDEQLLSESYTGSEDEEESDFIAEFGISNPGDQLLQTDKIKNMLGWPSMSQQPVSEYTTNNLAAKCFPTLFANRTGDPSDKARTRAVPFANAIRKLLKYAYQKPNGEWYYPFAAHPRFSFWALNMLQRKRAISQAMIITKLHQRINNYTINDMQKILTGDANTRPENFISTLQFHAGSITGSSPYWFKHSQNLRHLMQQKGAATLFITYSMADLYWPDLHHLLGTENKSMAERRKAVNINPHIVAAFFTKRIHDWNRCFMHDSLDQEWSWLRYENQNRGTIHCHMMSKLKNDPDLIKLCKIAFVGEKARKKKENGQSNVVELNELIKLGELAKEKVINYVDTLITTMNPLNQREADEFIVPTGLNHPSAKRIEQLNDEQKQNDYIELINTVQRHKNCTTYCRRYKKGKPVCRFNFPFAHTEKTELKFIEKQDKSFTVELITKRNDKKMNKHNRCQIYNFRSNVDMQIVLDWSAAVNYIAKYASKAEKQSESLQEILAKLINKFNEESDSVEKALKSLMIATLGQRDKSHQEAIQLLLSHNMPLVECDKFEFISISLLSQTRIIKLICFFCFFFLQ